MKAALINGSTGQDGGIDAVHGNPYNSDTLRQSLDQAKRITGMPPVHAYCDQGYRGVTTVVPDTAVHLTNKGKRKLSRSAWRWLRRRSAIEAVFGHLKTDNGLERNYLHREEGDRMDALLAGCGFNLRKLLRAFFLFLLFWAPFCRKRLPFNHLFLQLNRCFA